MNVKLDRFVDNFPPVEEAPGEYKVKKKREVKYVFLSLNCVGVRVTLTDIIQFVSHTCHLIASFFATNTGKYLFLPLIQFYYSTRVKEESC